MDQDEAEAAALDLKYSGGCSDEAV
jgi:hypothetical protein